MPTREEMRSLAEEIVGSYADRITGITQLRDTVKMDLKGFQDSRVTMSTEMRANLARGVADRKHEVSDLLHGFDQAHAAMSKEMKAGLVKGVANRKHEVGSLLDGFGQALATMGKEMRSDLVKGVADRKREVEDMLSGFSAELKEIRSELAGGHDEWQVLTANMQSKRGGMAVAVKPPEAVVAPPVEKIAEEEAAAEITPEIGDIRERVFEYLANHPDGTRMTELEEEFELARIQIAKVIKSLMDENKVEKRELLYFAI